MAGAFMVLLIMYFVPSIVAFSRSHKDAPAIVAVNFFFGWSVVGWIWALVWALADPRGRNANPTVVVNTIQHNGAFTASDTGPKSASDADTTFWDSIVDKRDQDSLEEYLVRFPEGRFVTLAKQRLSAGRPSSAEAAK